MNANHPLLGFQTFKHLDTNWEVVLETPCAGKATAYKFDTALTGRIRTYEPY